MEIPHDNLVVTPVTFKIGVIETTFKLGYKGIDDNGEYTLEVEGTPFDDLEEFKDMGEAPEVGHSTSDVTYGANTTRFDFLAFFKGRRTPVAIIHNLRGGYVTVDVRGKPQKSWQV